MDEARPHRDDLEKFLKDTKKLGIAVIKLENATVSTRKYLARLVNDYFGNVADMQKYFNRKEE